MILLQLGKCFRHRVHVLYELPVNVPSLVWFKNAGPLAQAGDDEFGELELVVN